MISPFLERGSSLGEEKQIPIRLHSGQAFASLRMTNLLVVFVGGIGRRFEGAYFARGWVRS